MTIKSITQQWQNCVPVQGASFPDRAIPSLLSTGVTDITPGIYRVQLKVELPGATHTTRPFVVPVGASDVSSFGDGLFIKFGNVAVGKTETRQISLKNTMKLSNVSIAKVYLETVGVVSQVSSLNEFSILNGRLMNYTLLPNQVETFEISFTPTTATNKRIDLIILSPTYGTIRIPISGSGVTLSGTYTSIPEVAGVNTVNLYTFEKPRKFTMFYTPATDFYVTNISIPDSGYSFDSKGFINTVIKAGTTVQLDFTQTGHVGVEVTASDVVIAGRSV